MPVSVYVKLFLNVFVRVIDAFACDDLFAIADAVLGVTLGL